MRGVLKSMARRALFPAVEGGYALAFAVVGKIVRPEPRWWGPRDGERVLVVAPHPDDETLACGGTIALHTSVGDSVYVLVVTDGGSSRAEGLNRERMRLLRAEEARAALGKLAPVSLVQLGLSEGYWSPGDLQSRLRAYIEKVRPTLIYAPSCVDFHPEHLKVASTLARTLASMPPNALNAVRIYELQVPLTPILANVAADISPFVGEKRAALAEYGTQAGSFRWVPRHARYLRKLYNREGNLELFWEVSPRQYCRLIQCCRREKPRFRSIRMRPFGDGPAWLVGLGARVYLKRWVERET